MRMRSLLLAQAVARSLQSGETSRKLPRLTERYRQAFANSTRPRRQDIVRFLLADPAFQRAAGRIKIRRHRPAAQQMLPAPAARLWPIPAIATTADLADWLSLYPNELDWFADLKGLLYRGTPPLRHYHYRLIPKSTGGVRIIEIPKPRLKYLQRRILTCILDRVPPHPAAHGFVKNRNIKSFAAPHTSQAVVLKMDLQDFFPAFRAARINAFFRTLGYPEPVAAALAGICTSVVPQSICRTLAFEDRDQYRRPHLPQGAPTSPALANLCAFRADCRLAGLAKSAGANYTRYADDLAFSGGEAFAQSVARFSTHVAAILHAEGFSVHHRKTRIMRQGVRQHLAGVVTNHHPNIPRQDFDTLKATLTNCIRHGPQSQNRSSHPDFRKHLEGRIAFAKMINPKKSERLMKLFHQINWN